MIFPYRSKILWGFPLIFGASAAPPRRRGRCVRSAAWPRLERPRWWPDRTWDASQQCSKSIRRYMKKAIHGIYHWNIHSYNFGISHHYLRKSHISVDIFNEILVCLVHMLGSLTFWWITIAIDHLICGWETLGSSLAPHFMGNMNTDSSLMLCSSLLTTG